MQKLDVRPINVILDAGFGDAGKGITTDMVCNKLGKKDSTKEIINVRFSGGPQAGHTVYVGDKMHIFSSFGSGSFRKNVTTYLLPSALMDPICVYNEFQVLKEKGVTPKLVVHPDVPVITPYDVFDNRACETTLKNGSCGRGIRATYKRNETKYSLKARDLKYPKILQLRLSSIKNGYYANHPELKMDDFFNAVSFFLENFEIKELDFEKLNCQVVYEGSQGLLLDRYLGFYPNTTPSRTGLQALKEIEEIPDKGGYGTTRYGCRTYGVDVYLVTRAYQTRHGNGFMTNEDRGHNIMDNPYEINHFNKYQGEFRKTILDLDLLEYAISSHGLNPEICHLVITHLDLVQNALTFTYKDEVFHFSKESEFVEAIARILGTKRLFVSHGPDSDNIQEVERN